ncbi:hypothetical protein F7725_008867 [Dissostichus mawsoni]|uniref:Uncharacterized protein n=1 Tax=Dissostichus mawsoni TaxID=36200 RepID=A0A7J5Z9H9_DISMA|nr:hypothetical protein F7725_008867 [Dissostichus mawsoni]
MYLAGDSHILQVLDQLQIFTLRSSSSCVQQETAAMTTTIVHFLVNGRPERAEFRDDCSAAEMFASDGHRMNISPKMQANDPESVYRLELSVEHLSWMGLFKEHGDQELSKLSQKPKSPELSEHEERLQVRRKYLNMSSLQVTEEVREHLKTPIFDNWQWEKAEMLMLLQ